MTTQLDFLPQEAPKPIPPPSKKTRTKKPEPEPTAKVVETPEKEVVSKASLYGVSAYVNIKTWGVRDRAGEWVEAPGTQWRASFTAKHLTHKEASSIFETHPQAFQLVDGCDIWACLSDEDEVFVVKKEKTDVPTPKAVPGAGGD